MPVIRLSTRRTRALDPIHPTTPRVGIFVKAARARSTGPQANQHPYVADEERAVRGQVRHALIMLGLILLSTYCSVRAGIAIWHLVRGLL
jgi:hypothetical protein